LTGGLRWHTHTSNVRTGSAPLLAAPPDWPLFGDFMGVASRALPWEPSRTGPAAHRTVQHAGVVSSQPSRDSSNRSHQPSYLVLDRGNPMHGCTAVYDALSVASQHQLLGQKCQLRHMLANNLPVQHTLSGVLCRCRHRNRLACCWRSRPWLHIAAQTLHTSVCMD